MKLLDKIAKRLGYVPEDSILVKPMVIAENRPVITLRDSMVIDLWMLDEMKRDGIDFEKWAKRKAIENLTDELIKCTEYRTCEDPIEHTITFNSRIRVVSVEEE